MEQKMYLTTGELAKLMGITKETLFHYDEIGLFRPNIVMPNGYRKYEIRQTELLNTILLLKDLGMPLKEIRELLMNRSPEKMLEVFSEREQKIQEEMTKLKNMKRWIANRKERIQTGLQTNPDEIRIQKFPERYYLYSSVETGNEEDSYQKTNALITRFLENNPGFKSDYEVAYIQHGKDVESGIYNQYDNTILLLENPPRKLSYQIFPAGEYLTACHLGNWRAIGSTYRRMLAYIREHGLSVADEYIERYLIDVSATDDPDSYITEIAVRLEMNTL